MRKIMYNSVLKKVKTSRFRDVIEKEVLDSHSKENHLVV